MQEERHAIKKRPLLSEMQQNSAKEKALFLTKAGVQQTLKELRKMHKQFEDMTLMVKHNIDQINVLTSDGKKEIDSFLFSSGRDVLDKLVEAEKKQKMAGG